MEAMAVLGKFEAAITGSFGSWTGPAGLDSPGVRWGEGPLARPS